MAGTTARLSLPYSQGSDPNNVPADELSLATKLDGMVVVFVEVAGSPAAGTDGRLVWDSTNKRLYYDDGTAVTPADAGVMAAKGDLLAGTGAHAAARIAVGADGTRLVADSTQTVGMRWAKTTVRDPRTICVVGQPVASTTSGDTGLFVVSVPTGQSLTLVGAVPVGVAGTGLTWKLARYTAGAWADIAGFGTTAAPLSDSTTVSGQSVPLTDLDRLGLWVVAAGASYKSFAVTLLLDRTV